MGIDTSIAWGTRQILILSIGYMCIGAWITESLSQAEIDHVDLIASFAHTHQKIVWFDITMNESFAVNVFDT